jgi:hypothetical protein
MSLSLSTRQSKYSLAALSNVSHPLRVKELCELLAFDFVAGPLRHISVTLSMGELEVLKRSAASQLTKKLNYGVCQHTSFLIAVIDMKTCKLSAWTFLLSCLTFSRSRMTLLIITLAAITWYL